MTQNTIYTSSSVEMTPMSAIPPIGFAGSNSGYSGSRGQPGYSGSRGGAGYAGSRGTAGAAGATGYAGSRGAGYAGSRGTAGAAGATGYAGSRGAGYAGSQGNVGYAGSTGIGIKGYTGSAGSGGGGGGYAGSRGNVGYAGSTGIGIKGYTGSAGSGGGGGGYAGSRGSIGYTGSRSTGYTGSAGSGSGGGGGYTRTTASSYAVLSNAASASLNITGFKSYTLYRIQTSVAAWVRLYSNAAARSADLTRISSVDPSFDAGVLAEVITTASGKTVYFTPAVAGYNTESTVTRNIPITVTNKSGASANVIVTLTLLQTEA